MTRSGGTRRSGLSALSAGLVALALSACLADAAAAQTDRALPEPRFPAGSVAPELAEFLREAWREAGEGSSHWREASGDVAAWQPALLLEGARAGGAPAGLVEAAAALDADDGNPELLAGRTRGLYAARAARPFDEAPALRARIERNLERLARAAREGGSVALAARVAWLHLLHRDFFDLGEPGAASQNGVGLALVEDLLARGRAPGSAAFAETWGGARPSVLATALAALALEKAYENEELVRYEDAAAEALAALADRGSGSALAPAGSESPGEARAEAYLALALVAAHESSGDGAARAKALDLLRRLGRASGLAATDPATRALAAYAILQLAGLDAGDPQGVGRRPMRALAAGAGRWPARELPAPRGYEDLFAAVYETLAARLPERDGDFAYDYGDSPGYAVRVWLAAGETARARAVLERGRRLLARPWPARFTEISFGTDAFLAALDHPEALARGEALAALRRALLLAGLVAIADRHYLDRLDAWTGGGGYDYGATTLGAQVAIPQLRFAAREPGARIAWLVDPARVGASIARETDRLAWDEARGAYLPRPGAPEIALLPNAMMILTLLELHAREPRAALLARAEAAAAGLEPLWDDARGAYFASESLRAEGGYQSLSGNSYALLAHLRLFGATHRDEHRARAFRIAEFVRRDLAAGGVIHHHLYRGRRAAGDLWCPGCNWRVLAILAELAALERAAGPG